MSASLVGSAMCIRDRCARACMRARVGACMRSCARVRALACVRMSTPVGSWVHECVRGWLRGCAGAW
eukprot:84922-Alexandrium_andersonii.AAC.1